MEFFGLDLYLIIFVAGFIIFWGGLFMAFSWFYNENQWAPRKYYKVKIYNKDGKYQRTVKGWPIKEKKVDYFRIQLAMFKGVHLDASVMEAMNAESELELTEGVPDLKEATNFRVRLIPLTQKEHYMSDLVEDVIKPLCVQELKIKNEDGTEATQQVYNTHALEFYKLKAQEALGRNSRIEDLNRSAAVRARIDVVRNQDERKKGEDSFIKKYEALIITVLVCLFAYLIMDGAGKNFTATAGAQAAVMENGYKNVVEQCGGVYHPLYAPVNNTTSSQGFKLPFS